MSNNKEYFILLFYISVMLLITYLQQEFILATEIENLDIVREETKLLILEKFERLRWLSYLLPVLMLFFRLFLVSFCLYLGCFFFTPMSGHAFNEWWSIALKSQFIMLSYSIIMCVIVLSFDSDTASKLGNYSSLLFLSKADIEPWIKLPLSAINLFEIAYWFLMSYYISKQVGTNHRQSLKFVLSTYGVGYLLYIVLLMFLMLYFGTNA